MDNLSRMLVAGSTGDLFTVTRVVSDIAPANNAVIGGRVTNSFGSGISNATLILTGGDLSAPRFAKTSSFGFYTFGDLTLGEAYTIRVVSKRHTFASPTRVIGLTGNIDDADFTAEEPADGINK